MKLEKREISLNEQDSLQDVLLMEKTLLNAYLHTLFQTTRKQVRDDLTVFMQEICKDALSVIDAKAACENR